MRLVDADAYKERNAEIIDCEIDHRKYQDTLRELIDDSPTIDATPVVRCKNCKWFGKIGCAIEVVDETDMPKEDDFCSFAERKDDE